jgi:hypothetical protein
MPYSSGLGGIPHPLPEVNFLIVEIPTLKPYIFMIRVTPKEHLGKVWLKLTKWFQRNVLFSKKTSGRGWG